ncbi:aromatic amino acid hydroxylase [Pedobacter alluvionis]|uniref:Aromatic amino acid hydroxylase n=1 Tax=Pedobacter alluvionis TaxID=475253 RepID=A0A497YES4_9SPHI|nr:aromatic amino acid hydroxylase [Pedobacter alluvionis]RLJ79949.1 phenylalanine-4-hydroxylase [Pedobacter alluvionis]TFB31253.1 aromatic amino acid hydroxylase [Pedobacter alluvionis]
MSHFNDFNNAQVAKLPNHLKQFIVDQNYEKYTPIDQAVWRYVMRQNYSYLKNVAYYPYIKGLQRAGLSIEHIPDLQTMNDNLGKIGWGAVTVDGFIPPAAFMEYQAYRVLVIAADIRQINHIEYTPAPDIIHESAGHAPIIADTDYNNYLSYFGSIGAKAMFSAKDFELYEAIRKLSILKEAVNADEFEIARAEKELRYISENMGEPSEMALLGRLHWWTVEYGLIGTLENPKIYGAGLLSSIGESATCMQNDVAKLWYNIDTINYAYDITKPQPQLFVTETFQNLIDVLEEFANTMAFRKGGTESIMKAIACKNVATAVYSSGLQVSGVFTDIGVGTKDEVTFIKTTGASALAFNGKQLKGHGKDYHADGFSSPVGRLKDAAKALEDYSAVELQALGIITGEKAELIFESGIKVIGVVKDMITESDKLLLMAFNDCTVTERNGNILFKPEWGIYDMAIGETIVSVFNGAADKDAYEEITLISKEKTHQITYDNKTLKLHGLYKTVREIRESDENLDQLGEIFLQLKTNHRQDWLCTLEILEIIYHKKIYHQLEKEIQVYLEIKAGKELDHTKLINDGLHVIKNPVSQLLVED